MCGYESPWNYMFSPGQPSGGGGGQHLQGYWGEGYCRQTLLFDHWWKDKEGNAQLHRLAVAKLYLDRYTDDYIWVIPRSITAVNKTRFANSLSANAFRKCTAGNKERSPCLVIHSHFCVAWRPFFYPVQLRDISWVQMLLWDLCHSVIAGK